MKRGVGMRSLSASKALPVAYIYDRRLPLLAYSHLRDNDEHGTDEKVGLGQPNYQILAVSSFLTALPIPPSSREYLYILLPSPTSKPRCMYLPISQITRNHSHHPPTDPAHRYPTHGVTAGLKAGGRKKEVIAI